MEKTHQDSAVYETQNKKINGVIKSKQTKENLYLIIILTMQMPPSN